MGRIYFNFVANKLIINYEKEFTNSRNDGLLNDNVGASK